MTDVNLGAASVELCAQCGAAWCEAGAVKQATGARREDPIPAELPPMPLGQTDLHGVGPEVASSSMGRVPNEWQESKSPPPSLAADVRSKSLSSSKLMVGIGVGLLLLAGGGVVAALTLREPPAATTLKTPLELYDGYQQYFVNVLFGGKTLTWWQDRLTSLAPTGALANAELFELTKTRATNAGLDVKMAEGRIEVAPNAQTKIALVTRMKLMP